MQGAGITIPSMNNGSVVTFTVTAQLNGNPTGTLTNTATVTSNGQTASQLTVELKDGRTFTGTVYGIDTLTDLAIVRIEATALPAATRLQAPEDRQPVERPLRLVQMRAARRAASGRRPTQRSG